MKKINRGAGKFFLEVGVIALVYWYWSMPVYMGVLPFLPFSLVRLFNRHPFQIEKKIPTDFEFVFSNGSFWAFYSISQVPRFTSKSKWVREPD